MARRGSWSSGNRGRIKVIGSSYRRCVGRVPYCLPWFGQTGKKWAQAEADTIGHSTGRGFCTCNSTQSLSVVKTVQCVWFKALKHSINPQAKLESRCYYFRTGRIVK
jgi:hypothetical protein